MPREFNININKEVINPSNKDRMLSNEGREESMVIADEILSIFGKRKTSMMDAYLILTGLSDAIYLHSILGDEDENLNNI